jgi:RNA 2',3'-cyclic 3'-phosphodiesterase
MRLFVALDIPGPIREGISSYVNDLRRIAPDVKWVRPESYHITLKFIGEWKRDVREVIEALKKVEAGPVDVAIRGNGFFPTERSPRVFWVGIEDLGRQSGEESRSVAPPDRARAPGPTLDNSKLAMMAKSVDEACSGLGIESEDRAFSPHLTLARSGSGSPRPKRDERTVPGMKRLAERIPEIPSPDFGTIHAAEFFLYESKLSPGGAQYTKLKGFRVKGIEDSS